MTDTTSEIKLTKSRDRGTTWYPPITVNSDGEATDQWMPWVTVDPNGYVHVVFYDSRVDPGSNVMTAVYVASSYNGGQSFADSNNTLVSTVAFKPQWVPGSRRTDYGYYMGDYIGIASSSGYVYPCWNDNRTGVQKAYVAMVPRYTPPPPGGGGGGCPHVYGWDGRSYRLENTILSESELSDSREPVTDYLKLQHPLADEGGRYKLQVREFESETSYLDEFELLVVDHPEASKAGVSPTGEVFLYEREYRPVAAYDHSGADILELLLDKDGRLYTPENNGVMDVYFEVSQPGLPGVLYDPVIPEHDAFGPPPPQKKGNPGAGLQVEIENSSGEWRTLDHLPPRGAPEDALWLLDAAGQEPPNRFRVRIRWGEELRVDQLAFFGLSQEKASIRNCTVVDARHSGRGESGTLLVEADGQLAILMRGDTLELSFLSCSSTSIPAGWTRSYILKSAGYYESNESVNQHVRALKQNHPNPFNSGTSIEFMLQRREHVRLEVYNILGQLIVTLLDDELNPGEHSVQWDAKDGRGEDLPSGVYLYRLTQGSSSESKKMSLVR